MPKPRAPSFAQLCAIVRRVIESDRTISDAEWKEATKILLVRQGYTYPTPEQLATALTCVERALVRQWGPRPIGGLHDR
jgi:hypothetical protein